MLKLLGRKTSGNVQKVLFALEEIGADYDREDYGRLFENTNTSAYLSLNPTAKVPTLVDGDIVIWESNTILRYLADTRNPDMTGATPGERTEVERWMDFILSAVNPGYLAGFKAAKMEPADRPIGFDGQIADLHAQMQIINRHLEGRNFLVLDKLTIADCAVGPILGRCLNFPYKRPSMPNLEHWFEGIAGRTAFKAATS